MRRSIGRVASAALVAALAGRVVWTAYSYYLRSAPRYPLESAAVALVAVGLLLILFRPGGAVEADRGESFSAAALPVFIVAAFALYADALGLGLLSDDFVLRAAARAGGTVTGAGGFFRPFPLLVWRADLGVTESPAALHALNILLHGLNAWLVGLLGVRLGLTRTAALTGAALFLTFPAAPEAVAWASGVQDVLMTSAALGAVLVAGGRETDPTRIAAVSALFLAALAAKETAVCVPLLIVMCWISPSRTRQPRQWMLLTALAALAAIYLIFRISVGVRAGFLVEPSRFLFKHITVTLFGSLAVPWRSPSSSATAWLAFVTTLAVTALVASSIGIWRRSDDRFVRAARLSLWVIAAVAPVYSYFYVDTQLEGSRYLYLADCGWALLLADLIWTVTDRVPGRAIARAAIVATAAAVSAVTLHRELAVWGRAAALRDRVLTQAQFSIDRARCTSAEFSNVPETVQGAFVFRNGLREALTVQDDAAPAAPDCRFQWRDDTFAPVR